MYLMLRFFCINFSINISVVDIWFKSDENVFNVKYDFFVKILV